MNSLRVRNSLRIIFSSCLLILLFSIAVWAQLYTSTVSGVVTDPTGAVVPNAQAKLVDEQKGYEFTATADSTGRYLFRSVPPGSYKVSVEASGFQTK